MSEEFHRLGIAAVRAETREALSLGLAVPPALRDAFRFKPGQHIAVRAMIDGEEVRRTYSITNSPGDDLLWITIKRVPGGAFSGWAHATLTAGQSIECVTPAGRFVLPDARFEKGGGTAGETGGSAPRIIAIAAGSGITPIAGLIETALARHPGTRATLIYGNRTVDDIIFRERLESLKNRHLARLQIFHVLSRDAESDVPLLSGRIDAEKIRALVPDVAGAPGLICSVHAFLCGPDSLIKTARATLLDMGTPREAIHHEFFRAGPQTGRARPHGSPVPPLQPSAAAAEVVVVHDGVRRTIQVADGQHVIDAAIRAGVKLPYSCKGGMCCTCRAKLVEGQVVMDRNFSLEAWEIEAGFVLTCQARPTTPRVVLDYDQV